MENRHNYGFFTKNEKEENKTNAEEKLSKEEEKVEFEIKTIEDLKKAIKEYQEMAKPGKTYAVVALKEMIELKAGILVGEKFKEITSYDNHNNDRSEEEKELTEKLTGEVETLLVYISEVNKELSKNSKPLNPILTNSRLSFNGHLSLNFSNWIIKDCKFRFNSTEFTIWDDAALRNVTFEEDSAYSLYKLARAASCKKLTFDNPEGHDFEGGEITMNSEGQRALLRLHKEMIGLERQNTELSQKNDKLSQDNAKLSLELTELKRKLENEDNVKAKKQKQDKDAPQFPPQSPPRFNFS